MIITVWNFWEKVKLHKQQKSQWLPGVKEKGAMKRQSRELHRLFLVLLYNAAPIPRCLSKRTGYSKPRMNPDINYGL